MKNVNLQDSAKTKTAEDVRQRYNLDVIKSMTSKQTNSGYAVGIGKKAAVSKGLDIAGEIMIDDKITTAKGYFDANGAQICPSGMSFEWNSDTIPVGYLEENGAAISRTTYAGLFAAIGTTFGVGNGSTTFNLPNSGGKVAVSKAASGTFGILGTGSTSALGNETHVHGSTNVRNGTLDAAVGSTDSNANTIGFAHSNDNNVQVIAPTYKGNITMGTGGYFSHWTKVYGATASGSSLQPSIVKRKIIKY